LVASYASDHVLSIVVLDLSYETLSAKSTPHFYHPQGTPVPVANPSKDSEQVIYGAKRSWGGTNSVSIITPPPVNT